MKLQLQKRDTLFDELERIRRRVMDRAYEIFQDRGALSGRALDDWLTAEQQMIWKPPIELKERDEALILEAALPGVEPTDLDIQITPEALLIKADTGHRHTEESGAVHVCEFQGGTLFRSIPLPRRVDADQAKAEYRNGLLRITVPVAKPAPAASVAVEVAQIGS